MLLYEGLFVKANGDLRSMRFVRLSDIPKNILEANTRGKKIYGRKQRFRTCMGHRSQSLQVFQSQNPCWVCNL